MQEEVADADLLGDDTTRMGERWGDLLRDLGDDGREGERLGELEPVAAANGGEGERLGDGAAANSRKGERLGEPSGAAANSRKGERLGEPSGAAASGAAASGAAASGGEQLCRGIIGGIPGGTNRMPSSVRVLYLKTNTSTQCRHSVSLA